MKLQLAVHLCLGRAGVTEEVQYANATLKKHYKLRLDALQGETLQKRTFTAQQMPLHMPLPKINIHHTLSPAVANIDMVLNERAFNTVEEQFCQLLASTLDPKKQKEILQQHFYETQTRPEFIFHLVLVYYKKGSVRKALQLCEQFMLKGPACSGQERLYRQSKVPSLMLMRLKLVINYLQDYQQGIETASYLLTLSSGDKQVLDEDVCEYMGLSTPGKRAFYLYLAGVAHLIYSQQQPLMLYAKAKQMRKRAEQYLLEAAALDPTNSQGGFHLAMIYALLGKAKAALGVLTKNGVHREEAAALQAIMFVAQCQVGEAYSLVVNLIKSKYPNSLILHLIKLIYQSGLAACTGGGHGRRMGGG